MMASIGNVNAAGGARAFEHERAWRTAFWVVLTVVLALRLVLAASLAPFGDEAWYWQESRALDGSYSDLPVATALLIRLGESLFGHGVLAMRAPFLLLGALLPWILVGTARRLFGAAAGWCTGTLALLLPLIGTLGIFALPDVPLTLCSALALDAMERAARTRRTRDWLTLGLALAGAWLSHYRAAMLLAAGFAFLCLTRRGRGLWREPGLWLALGVSCLGLLPLLVFNATHDWAALRFQLVERNPWSFHADALVQPLEQALVCTPLFYLLLLWAAWRCLRRAREGAPWELFALCGIVPIAAFFVLGCFADDTRFRVHWPLPGYLPLLLALPPLVAAGGRGVRRAFAAALAVLVLGAAGTFAYLGTAATPDGAALLTRFKAFPEHFVGWQDAAARTRELLAEPRFADAVLVADNFMLAAELDFALGGTRPVYSLDHPINAKHGRAPQLALWQRDEAALRALGAVPVLLVAEPTARRERERLPWMQTLCTRLDHLVAVAALDPYGGRKRYRWYAGVVPTADRSARSPDDCPAAAY
jgi:4-amino-4-deoxy-L-arabinose transferase-like glycosyltransferase